MFDMFQNIPERDHIKRALFKRGILKGALPEREPIGFMGEDTSMGRGFDPLHAPPSFLLHARKEGSHTTPYIEKRSPSFKTLHHPPLRQID